MSFFLKQLFYCFPLFMFVNVLFSFVFLVADMPPIFISSVETIQKVLQEMEQAQSFVGFSTLSIPTEPFAKELVKALERGVEVKVLISNPNFLAGQNLDEFLQRFSIDKPSVMLMQQKLKHDETYISYLTDCNYYPHFLRRDIYYSNHPKLLIIDNTAIILTSPKDHLDRRDFGLTVREPKIVEALKNFLLQDYQRQPYQKDPVLEEAGFVIGPEGQREKIEKQLLSASRSIHIYAADLNDDSIVWILEKMLKKGVSLHILTTPYFFGFCEESLKTNFFLKKLQKLGAEVLISRNPKIHAKITIIDYGTKTQSMYFGSCNLFKSSLDYSRELGIITSDVKYIEPVMGTFRQDAQQSVKF